MYPAWATPPSTSLGQEEEPLLLPWGWVGKEATQLVAALRPRRSSHPIDQSMLSPVVKKQLKISLSSPPSVLPPPLPHRTAPPFRTASPQAGTLALLLHPTRPSNLSASLSRQRRRCAAPPAGTSSSSQTPRLRAIDGRSSWRRSTICQRSRQASREQEVVRREVRARVRARRLWRQRGGGWVGQLRLRLLRLVQFLWRRIWSDYSLASRTSTRSRSATRLRT